MGLPGQSACLRYADPQACRSTPPTGQPTRSHRYGPWPVRFHARRARMSLATWHAHVRLLEDDGWVTRSEEGLILHWPNPEPTDSHSLAACRRSRRPAQRNRSSGAARSRIPIRQSPVRETTPSSSLEIRRRGHNGGPLVRPHRSQDRSHRNPSRLERNVGGSPTSRPLTSSNSGWHCATTATAQTSSLTRCALRSLQVSIRSVAPPIS